MLSAGVANVEFPTPLLSAVHVLSGRAIAAAVASAAATLNTSLAGSAVVAKPTQHVVAASA